MLPPSGHYRPALYAFHRPRSASHPREIPPPPPPCCGAGELVSSSSSSSSYDLARPCRPGGRGSACSPSRRFSSPSPPHPFRALGRAPEGTSTAGSNRGPSSRARRRGVACRRRRDASSRDRRRRRRRQPRPSKVRVSSVRSSRRRGEFRVKRRGSPTPPLTTSSMCGAVTPEGPSARWCRRRSLRRREPAAAEASGATSGNGSPAIAPAA